MKRAKRNQKLQAGLGAYTESARAHCGVASFFQERLSQWPKYAAAAGSALALSTSAMADIIHESPFFSVVASASNPAHAVAFLNLGGYGTVTASVRNTAKYALTHVSANQFTWANRLQVNGGKLMVNGSGNVLPLSKGVLVTSVNAAGGQHLLSSGTLGFTFFGGRHHRHAGSFGVYYQPLTHYVGFVLPNGDPGWLKVNSQESAIFIDEWALAIKGETITVGETQTPPGCIPTPIRPCSGGNNGSGGTGGGGGGGGTTVPEPSSFSLSLLAMGSVAVLAWKKLRSERA